MHFSYQKKAPKKPNKNSWVWIHRELVYSSEKFWKSIYEVSLKPQDFFFFKHGLISVRYNKCSCLDNVFMLLFRTPRFRYLRREIGRVCAFFGFISFFHFEPSVGLELPGAYCRAQGKIVLQSCSWSSPAQMAASAPNPLFSWVSFCKSWKYSENYHT